MWLSVSFLSFVFNDFNKGMQKSSLFKLGINVSHIFKSNDDFCLKKTLYL